MFWVTATSGDLSPMRSTSLGIRAIGPTYAGVVADTFDYTTPVVGLAGCLPTSSLPIVLAEQ